MDYPPNESILLNEREFLVLLAAAGRGDGYGIADDGSLDWAQSETEMNEILSSLYQKGLIDWGDRAARIADAYRPMFLVLRGATACVLMVRTDESDRIVSCYPLDDRIVTVEQNPNGTRELRLSYETAEEWAAGLMRNGWTPEMIQAEEPAGTFPPYEWDPQRDLREYLTDPGVISALELRTVPDGMLQERMIIRDAGLCGVLDRISRRGTVRDLCSPEAFRAALQTWSIGGEK